LLHNVFRWFSIKRAASLYNFLRIHKIGLNRKIHQYGFSKDFPCCAVCVIILPHALCCVAKQVTGLYSAEGYVFIMTQNVPVLVVHGGAGSIDSAAFDRAALAARHQALAAALQSGMATLEQGGAALDAVCAAVCVLEDCAYFNAGHGAVLAANERAELDASVMNGADGNAGGVSTLSRVRNPVLAARAVMAQTPHTILCGPGGDEFAQSCGLTMVENEYFITAARREALVQAQQRVQFDAEKSLGTVGAAARDARGHLAAATSTGGLSNKMPGRVSDSAIPGAGTWARDNICALSCTGTGDLFIRRAAAHEVGARVRFRGDDLVSACDAVLAEIKQDGGSGGIIGIDGNGEIVMAYNAPEMYRGFIRAGQEPQTFIA